MNSSEAALNAFVRDKVKTPFRDRYAKDVAAMRQDVEKLLEANVKLEKDLEEKRNAILEKIPEVNTLKAETQHLALQVDEEIRGRFSKASLVEDLRKASLADEEKSDAIAEEFLAGNVDLETFRKDYIALRSRFHVRKAKREKFLERK